MSGPWPAPTSDLTVIYLTMNYLLCSYELILYELCHHINVLIILCHVITSINAYAMRLKGTCASSDAVHPLFKNLQTYAIIPSPNRASANAG